MSTRHLLNLTTGVVAVLLLASVGFVFKTLNGPAHQAARFEVVARQQALVQDLDVEVTALAQAGSLPAVNQARQGLGQTILDFDRNLAALLHGGSVTNAKNETFDLPLVTDPAARQALESASALWLDTGLALADLAAGEYSVFSAAGQQAVIGLEDNQEALKAELGNVAAALESGGQTAGGQAGLARVVLGGLLLAMGGLILLRFRPIRSATPENSPAPAPQNLAPQGAVPMVPQATDPVRPQAHDWSGQSHQAFTSPVDFDNLNASVDQMSVDMNTIAGSTEKMRLAIDSVGHAMQGMLYSLNEMAQDTAEGYKIVRGANNAASYTANAAEELVSSAREMARVVSRVTQLAVKTKQVAAQIEAEAVNTGQTGETFTSVVAAEVKGLAAQTSQTTGSIEQTVSEILATARQYEEAIGQIIKNISAINKVSQNLGELMLHPPAVGVAGTPLPSAQALNAASPAPAATPAPAPAPVAAADPEPEPAPEAPVEMIVDEDIEDEPSIEELAAETNQAINEALGLPETETAPETEAEPETETEPVAAEPVVEEKDEESAGSNGNVFMLGGAKKKTAPAKPAEPVAAAEPEPEAPPEPEAKTEAPAASEPAAEPVAEEEDTGGNIFMLNKPRKAAPVEAQATPEPEPEPAPEPKAKVEETPAETETTAEAAEEDSGSNIFMLSKPKKAAPAAETPAEPEAEPEPEPEPAAEEAVTVPAEGEKDDDGGGNIFMLNKPKK